MDRRQRIVLLGIAALIAVVAVVVAVTSGGGNDNGSTNAAQTGSTSTQSTGGQPAGPDTTATQTAPQATVDKIEVKGGQPVGGLKKITVKKGEQVEIDVTADAADEAHLHGYDIEKELQPGKTARFRFKADIEGVFELELHHAGTQLARLTVKP
jgi:FtsP/CotA-like multicopper oxidase with cupredoxin domain